MMEVIAISGGIGSGKSIVCRILQSLGYKVYDCDSRAKEIMEADKNIKQAIAKDITPEAIDSSGRLQRKAIASVVFSDQDKLSRLNAIVHGAVRHDIEQWIAANRMEPKLFIETAILYQSGVDKMVDKVWEVTAPEDERVRRACRRDGVGVDEVKARIQSQVYEPTHRHPAEICLVNDGEHSLLKQIDSLINR